MTLAVERIDIELARFVSGPTGARKTGPASSRDRHRPESAPTTASQPSATATNGSEPAPATAQSTDVSREGVPTLSEEVVVTAPMPMLSTSIEAGKMSLSPEQVETLPSLGTRTSSAHCSCFQASVATKHPPGFPCAAARIKIVSYDGFTVYSVDHLFGYFSAFNMDAVDAVDINARKLRRAMAGGYRA